MELLKKLYTIHSMSGREKKMKRFIRKWISENLPEAVVTNDKTGNLYITKGESSSYPCIVAHLDQVQNSHSRDFVALEAGDIIIGYSSKSRSQQGLGADDKNGIWVCLKCLLKYDAIKVALFVSEEVGCVGSSGANMKFFNDVRFVLQCDRRGAHDLITDASWVELCSKEFVNAIQPQLFGYKETSGLMTDVMTLKENGLGVSCVNISCGYYEPHTDTEFTSISDLNNCLAFVEHIFDTCVEDRYPHEYTYTPYSSKYAGYYNDVYEDFYNGKSKGNSTISKYSGCNESNTESCFREVYYDVVKEILQFYPDAKYDTVLWYLRESFPSTTFWDDWTRKLYCDVLQDLQLEVNDVHTNEEVAEIEKI